MRDSSARRIDCSSAGGGDAGRLPAGACLAYCLHVLVLAGACPLVGVPLGRSAGLPRVLPGIAILLAPLTLIHGCLAHPGWVIVRLGVAGAVLLLTGATQAGLDGCARVLAWIEGSLPTRSLSAQDWAGFCTTPAGSLLVGAARAGSRRGVQSTRGSCRRGDLP